MTDYTNTESRLQLMNDAELAEWFRELSNNHIAAVVRDAIRRHTDFFVGQDEYAEMWAVNALQKLRQEVHKCTDEEQEAEWGA